MQSYANPGHGLGQVHKCVGLNLLMKSQHKLLDIWIFNDNTDIKQHYTYTHLLFLKTSQEIPTMNDNWDMARVNECL